MNQPLYCLCKDWKLTKNCLIFCDICGRLPIKLRILGCLYIRACCWVTFPCTTFRRTTKTFVILTEWLLQTLGANSATRLGDFLKFLLASFHTKVAQLTIWGLLGLFWKHSCLKLNLLWPLFVNFRQNWATFYFNIGHTGCKLSQALALRALPS